MRPAQGPLPLPVRRSEPPREPQREPRLVAGPPRRAPTGHPYLYGGRRYPPLSAAPYRWPHGHRGPRYAIGAQLPPIYRSSAYVIGDWADYGLLAPSRGDEWIRYGDDLLEIDGGGDVVAAIDDAYDTADYDANNGSQDVAPLDPANDPSGDPTDELNAGTRAAGGGDVARAITLFTEAIDSGQLTGAEKRLAYLKRGQCYAAMRDRRALEDLAQAQALDPSDQTTADLLARAKAALGEAPAARVDWPLYLALGFCAVLAGIVTWLVASRRRLTRAA